MEAVPVTQLFPEVRYDFFLFNDGAEVCQVFNAADDFACLVSYERCIFQNMKLAAVFFLKNTFAAPSYNFV